MGLSSRPEGGYDKKNQGHDIAGVLGTLRIEEVDLICHDIGNMVGYAFAAQYPNRVARFVLMDAPLPGVGPWEEILKNPLLWHFRFGGPDMERLVAGRERIISIASGTSFRLIPRRSAKAPANTTLGCMRSPALCMRASPNLQPSTRTPLTTRHSSPKAN
jgi:pimeloyl-ACP methyl ester carboxylesterase